MLLLPFYKILVERKKRISVRENLCGYFYQAHSSFLHTPLKTNDVPIERERKKKSVVVVIDDDDVSVRIARSVRHSTLIFYLSF
jgi:hypothetical protein